MPARLRGSEALIRITVDEGEGIDVPQEGSFFKVRDFRAVPRIDNVEEGYLGEVADDLDQQFHGFDGSFTIDMTDTASLDYLTAIVSAAEGNRQPPKVKVMVEYVFRDEQDPVREVYSEAVMKVAEGAIAGRKEYIQHSFEFKAKIREQYTV